ASSFFMLVMRTTPANAPRYFPSPLRFAMPLIAVSRRAGEFESHARRSRLGGAKWLDGNFVRTLLSRLRKHRTEKFGPRFTYGRVGGNVTSQRTKWRQGCRVLINLNKHGRDSPYSLDRALPNWESGTVFGDLLRSPARRAITLAQRALGYVVS